MVGHDTEVISRLASTSIKLQAEDPPVGLVENKMFPELSAATHSPDDGQSIELIWFVPSRVSFVHAEVVGVVEYTIPPCPSVATHRPVVGHDIDERLGEAPSIKPGAELHAVAPPVGLVDAKA